MAYHHLVIQVIQEHAGKVVVVVKKRRWVEDRYDMVVVVNVEEEEVDSYDSD